MSVKKSVQMVCSSRALVALLSGAIPRCWGSLLTGCTAGEFQSMAVVAVKRQFPSPVLILICRVTLFQSASGMITVLSVYSKATAKNADL